MPSINFFEEDISFKVPQKLKIKDWLKYIAKKEGVTIVEINYILCSDQYLKQVNIDYLQHDYYTDIITFDNSDDEGKLEGDIFISIDRVKDNCISYTTSLDQEFRRVLIHGVLHLIGYSDKTEEDQQLMRQKENECLSLFPQANQS